MLPAKTFSSSDSRVTWVQGVVMAVLHGRPDMVWPFEGKGSEEDGVCYLVHSVSFTEEVLDGAYGNPNDI